MRKEIMMESLNVISFTHSEASEKFGWEHPISYLAQLKEAVLDAMNHPSQDEVEKAFMIVNSYNRFRDAKNKAFSYGYNLYILSDEEREEILAGIK